MIRRSAILPSSIPYIGELFALAALLLREPVTWKRVAGLALGLGGVAMVTFG